MEGMTEKSGGFRERDVEMVVVEVAGDGEDDGVCRDGFLSPFLFSSIIKYF